MIPHEKNTPLGMYQVVEVYCPYCGMEHQWKVHPAPTTKKTLELKQNCLQCGHQFSEDITLKDIFPEPVTE